jgi:hypothetical protein
LDKRFPEKVVVLAADYAALHIKLNALDEELSIIRGAADDAKKGIEILVSRIGSLESKSAHVEVVRTLLAEVKKLQDEYSSLKTSLGLNRAAQPHPDAAAYLNDLPVGGYDAQ